MNKMHLLVLVSCLSVTSTVVAKEKPIILSDAVKPALSGKTLVVTRHQKPDFAAMTAGKAAFAMVGAFAMIGAGNKIVQENNIPDPADLIEAQLAPAIARHYGMQLKEAVPRSIAATKPAAIAATQSGADYVLDVRSGGWMFLYYPGDWSHYWLSYSVQVQMIDVASSAQMANAVCLTNTRKHPNSPTRESMLLNSAKLLKDMATGLAWSCVQTLGKEEFAVPADVLGATPAEYTDVLAAFAASQANPQPAASATADTASVPSRDPAEDSASTPPEPGAAATGSSNPG